MSIATPDFLIPDGMLPDGSITWTEKGSTADAVVERLREYDPRLSLILNVEAGEWEVWRMGEDNKARRISRLNNGGKVPNGDQLIAQLAAYDTRKGYDPAEAIIAEEDRAERLRDAELEEAVGDGHDRLHHALAHDLSAHAPAVRPIPLGGRR